MKRLAWLLLAALALLPAVTVWGQVRIVRVGGSRPVEAPQPPKPADPAKPEAEAVEPTKEEAARIAELIDQLGAPRLSARDRAMAELASYAEKALRQVREGKSHQDDEIANRCEIMEEVISSKQAELFLAARRLSLEPAELERLLGAEDVQPLLALLKSRAQPGMTPVWARVLAKLAGRPQLVMAAQLCIAAEGAEGYGGALAGAGKQATLPAQAASLVTLASLLPPARAADAVQALSRFGIAIGGAHGVEGALMAAQALRGGYGAPEALAAIEPVPEPGPPAGPEFDSLRHAVALCLVPACTEAELAAAALPAFGTMSTLALQQYLNLLGRSGLAARAEGALVALVAQNAPARAMSLAGAAWASLAPVSRIESEFESLPYAARIGALDALWLNPREAARTRDFLAKLLAGSDEGMRAAAARMLGQYRSPTTARLLAESALAQPGTAQFALESLHPMADLLTPAQLDGLSGMLKTAGAATRPALLLTLVAARHEASCKALLEQWKQHLPRNELLPACTLLERDPASPAGACAAVIMLGPDTFEGRSWEAITVEPQPLGLLRVLLASPREDALALLARLAGDETSALRWLAAATLSMCGQEGPYIEDWIRRLAGEVTDRQGRVLMLAVSLSAGKAAEDFRARIMQQGSSSPHMYVVVNAVQHGRTKAITPAQLAATLFDTPAGAQQWVAFAQSYQGQWPAEALKNLATGLLFTEDTTLLDDPTGALYLAETGVDVQPLLFGQDATGAPRDGARLTLAALMGEPGKAGELLARAEVVEDGSNYSAIQFARAWLGQLPPADCERLVRAADSDATLRLFVLRRRALEGHAPALRALLDRFGLHSGRFAPGATAGVELKFDRWSRQEVELQGVAGEVLAGEGSGWALPRNLLARVFGQAPQAEWDLWWQSRRALLARDAATGKYKFEELP